MVDQPTQAFVPSESAKTSGDVKDADRDNRADDVRRLKSLVEELAPKFQIIVSDCADLEFDWFQDSVRHTWRDGVKLVPVA
jgi:hypothetical protein